MLFVARAEVVTRGRVRGIHGRGAVPVEGVGAVFARTPGGGIARAVQALMAACCPILQRLRSTGTQIIEFGRDRSRPQGGWCGQGCHQAKCWGRVSLKPEFRHQGNLCRVLMMPVCGCRPFAYRNIDQTSGVEGQRMLGAAGP